MNNDWYEWKLIGESKNNLKFELIVKDKKSEDLKRKFEDFKPHYIIISKIRINNVEYSLNGDDIQ